MKAKLIKVNNIYYLWLKPETEERELIASSKYITEERGYVNSKYKLSSSNCLSIEKGYDREELKNLAKTSRTKIRPLFRDKIDAKSHEEGYIAGFLKAHKMRAKRFTKIDMKKIFDIGFNAGLGAIQGENKFDFKRLIQSLQQSEWDVTFNPEELDAYGCYILKRK
jgi:hypothetical protein